MSSASQRNVVLRVRTKDGQHRIDCLSSESTVGELKGVLEALTGSAPRRILAGYPPTPLDLDSDSQRLGETTIRSGDTLILEQHHHNAASNTPQASNSLGAAKNVVPCDDLNNRMLHETAAESISQPPGILMRRVVPANNSCLFTSVYFGISSGKFDMRSGANLRQVIAEAVAADPQQYCEAFLGKPNREYCTWILNEDHWGGAIELAILSKHFLVEIVAVDTQNVRLNKFGENENYSKRILVIYDGIHYDPLMLEDLSGAGGTKTIFNIKDEQILMMALELAHEANTSRQFTDIQNFSLRCLSCNEGFVGQAGAQTHAKNTGHTNFGEVL